MSETSSSAIIARRQEWLQQIDTALRLQGLEPAAQLALQAVAEGVEHPVVLNLAASARFGEGRIEEAAELLRRAYLLAPTDPHVLNSLGTCLQALGRADEALEAYDAALSVDPRLAAAHFNRGTLLEELNDLNGSRAAYERASALDQSYVEPLASLAWLDAQAGKTTSARGYSERAMALSPGNLLAHMATASLDLQQGDFSAAAWRLSELERYPAHSPVNQSIVFGLIADLKDAEGRPVEAFSAYEQSNRILKTLYASKFEVPGKETALDQARRLGIWFESASPEIWTRTSSPKSAHSDLKAHVFLVGFPRSGTTLLENVLAAHPEVISLEEKNCLERVSIDFVSSNEGLDRLAQINAEDAAQTRDAYWAMVRSFGAEPDGKVFIDKFPLSSVLLPVVFKLFPDAQVLLARRDPRDVVLSCFRRRFAMNASMYQLLTLEGAATFYDAVARLSELFGERLPLPRHIVRYENLVEDFEATVRAAFDFLGLEWDPGVFDFADKARARGIDTPSAAQVVRGLNRDGRGVWRRYQQQMAPVLPILEPWVERFGYASE